MNHEHVSLQIHCDSFIPGILSAVSNGIDKYLALVQKRSLGVVGIVITDNVDFAQKAFESNDIVILVSSQPETVTQGIIVCESDREAICEAVCSGCSELFAT